MLLLEERHFICCKIYKTPRICADELKRQSSCKQAYCTCSHLSSTALKGASPLWELVSLIIARSCTESLGPPALTFLSLCSFLFLLLPTCLLGPLQQLSALICSESTHVLGLHFLCNQFPVGGSREARCVKYSAVMCLFTIISLWIAVICR